MFVPLGMGLAAPDAGVDDRLMARVRRKILMRVLQWYAEEGPQERQIANLLLALYVRGMRHNEAAIVAGVRPEMAADLEQAGLDRLRQVIEAMGHRPEHLL